ncbi:MAG: hypothetical protein HS113_11590 [Verrucomicrobiales bacterium]|nr:hypothetical protein [Verrucomicrobiales bacterium]
MTTQTPWPLSRRDFLGLLGVGSSAALLPGASADGAASPAAWEAPAAATDPPRARFSLRIGIGLWSHPQRLGELLDWCRDYRAVLDEVALFTSATHAPLPLPELERRAQALGEVLPRFRALGLQAGINHLATLGHADEDVERALREPWQRFTGHDGLTAQACYCASDPRVMAYVGRCYERLAAAGPDFLWVDDDLRLESRGPVRFGCFCERCLQSFSEPTGRSWTRADLVAALDAAPLEERLRWRKRWLAHNRGYVAGVLRTVRAAVDRANPRLPLGYMSAELTYSGYGWTEWPAALAGPSQLPVKWRPGGGFYTDETPTALLGKAHSVGRQLGGLSDTVIDRPYEHENYPYQPLKKSVTLAMAEVAAALGAGCTGTTWNGLGLGSDPFSEFRPYFDAMRAQRPFFDRLVAAFGSSRCEGVWPALSEDHFATVNAAESWFTAPVFGRELHGLNELAELGLPLAYHPAGARLTVLAGDAVRQFSEATLEGWFKGGVLLDGPALRILQGLGLREWVGFRLRGLRPAESLELLTDHPLNRGHAGWQRDCRSFITPETTWLIEPAEPGAQVLAEIVDLGGQRFGPASGVFENPSGGRVAVAGYYPWRHLQSLAKTRQMRALCRWLSRDTLPACVDSHARVALWCRRTPGGEPAILLLNASVDPAIDLAVLVRDAPRLQVIRSNGQTSRLSPVSVDLPYRRFTLPSLGPWEPALLVAAAAV